MSPNSTQTLFDYLKTQEEDKMCTSVSIYCQKGWPERKNEIATDLRPYWNARSELTVDKNSYYSIKNELLIQSHSRGTLEKIHSGHQEVQRCRLWANKAVWWPGLSHEVETVPHLCTECYPSATAHDPNKVTYQTLHGKRLVQTFGWACALRWVRWVCTKVPGGHWEPPNFSVHCAVWWYDTIKLGLPV